MRKHRLCCCSTFLLVHFVVLFSLSTIANCLTVEVRKTGSDFRPLANDLPPQTGDAHLFSLKWVSLDNPEQFSKPVRDTWRWKDQVLGDGRDYFVPRPKTIQALQSHVVGQSTKGSGNIEECVVLSNCARFEFIVYCNNPREALTELATIVVAQTQSCERMTLKKVQLSFDLPGNIDCHAKTTGSDQVLVEELASEKYWTHLAGPENVCRHLCRVAAGMADRPSRPGRPVPFQPFSSRDAHVMLQLKRTMENIGASPRLALLMRHALLAGKHVRNPDKIPELEVLRRYGPGKFYDGEPPPDLLEEVTRVATEKGIEPAVLDCMEAWSAYERGAVVQSFRNAALEMAQNGKEKKWLTQQLHEPTLWLRQGKDFDQDVFLEDLRLRLQSLDG